MNSEDICRSCNGMMPASVSPAHAAHAARSAAADGHCPPPIPAPSSVSVGCRLIAGLWRTGDQLLGFAGIIVSLAVVSAIPFLNLLSLGCFLKAPALVGKSGSLRDGFIGIIVLPTARAPQAYLHFSPPFVTRRREDLLLQQPERIEAKRRCGAGRQREAKATGTERSEVKRRETTRRVTRRVPGASTREPDFLPGGSRRTAWGTSCPGDHSGRYEAGAGRSQSQ
jgi:hypothetical protein